MSIRYGRYDPHSTEFLTAAVELRRQKTPQPYDSSDSVEAEIVRIRTELLSKKPIQGIGYLAIAHDSHATETVAGYAYAHEMRGLPLPKAHWWNSRTYDVNYVDLGGLNVHKHFMGEDVSLTLGLHMLSDFKDTLALPDASGMMPPLLSGAFDDPENQGHLDVPVAYHETVGDAAYAIHRALTFSEQRRESAA